MFRELLRQMIFLSMALLIAVAGVSIAYGRKPPWAGGPGSPHDRPPVTAPEPTALSLIGMGAVGVAVYYLNRRRRKIKNHGHTDPVRKDEN